MELTFVKEEIPKITRAGGSGREAEPWETHLAQLKDTPGDSFRVWTYDKRTSAQSRMSSVRERLTKAVPSENWTIAVRPIAGSNPEQFGVYVAFNGTYTDEEVAANAKAHSDRSERVRAARARTATPDPTFIAPVEEAEATTAKERVAAARAAKV